MQKNLKFLKKFFSTNNDAKFKETAAKFKETWNIYSSENPDKEIENITKNLSPDQKAYVELLSKKFILLNSYQLEYYNILLQENLSKKLSLIDINTNWPKVIKENSPPVNPSYFKQQEQLSEFTKWLSAQEKTDLGLGFAQATVVEAEAPKEIKSKQPDQKIEKAEYDIELTSFDPAKKIALIKEVRAYTSLGLKESKEFVEKAPVILMKGVKKEDCDAIVKKLSDSGAKITLK